MPSDPRLRTTGTFEGVHWLYVPMDATAVPSVWLSPNELAHYEAFRHPSRRAAWLAGRIAAKQCLAWHGIAEVAPAAVEIHSRDVAGRGVPPEVRIHDEPVPVSLSLAHTDRGVLVAVTDDSEIRVGVDLTVLEEVRPAALAPWMTSSERATLSALPDDWATVWSVKEAVYKAVCFDEPFTPHRFEVSRHADEWCCRVNGRRISARILAAMIDEQSMVVAIVDVQERTHSAAIQGMNAVNEEPRPLAAGV